MLPVRGPSATAMEVGAPADIVLPGRPQVMELGSDWEGEITNSSSSKKKKKNNSSKASKGLKFRDFASLENMTTNAAAAAEARKRPAAIPVEALSTMQPRGKRRRRRDKRPAAAPSRAAVLGSEVELKVVGGAVLFKTDTVLPLVERLVPTAGGVAAVRAGARKLGSASDPAAVKDFLSWNTVKTLISESLFDQALRDMLNRYEPFQGGRVVGSNPAEGSSGSLERDHITVVGVEIAFLVSRGKVYFDILGSFSILGELRLAMRNRWEKVDAVLARAGLSQREAFRRCQPRSGRYPAASSSSQRSHISLSALVALAGEGGLVADPARRETLARLLSHLEGEVFAIGGRKQRLYDQLQCVVDQALEKTGQLNNNVTKEEAPDGFVDAQPCADGTEACDGNCGRSYHFTSRCCDLDHTLDVGSGGGGGGVGYVVRGDQVFLDKCAAFSALGRSHVVRYADYRKADRFLADAGMSPREHYLFESSPGGNAACAHSGDPASTGRRRGGRRTHMSLEAFVVLARRGFAVAARSEGLAAAAAQVVAAIPDLKRACPNYNPEAPAAPAADASEDFSSTDAGAASAAEEVKTEEPAAAEADPEHESPVSLLGRTVAGRVERGRLYLHLQGAAEFLSDEDRLVPRLKRKVRALPGGAPRHPFFPSYFRRTARQFISAECLLRLIDADLVTPIQPRLADELQALDRTTVAPPADHQERDRAPPQVEPGSQGEEGEDEEEDDDKGEDGEEEEEQKPVVEVLGEMVPFQVVSDNVYLEKKAVFRLCGGGRPDPAGSRAYRAMDRIIEHARLCVDDAFLYEGRRRGYISTAALRVLVERGFLPCGAARPRLLSRLTALEGERESLRTNRVLALSFGNLNYKTTRRRGGNGSVAVYIHTIQALRAVGFSPQYLVNSRSKIYFVICRLLTARGLQQAACFLRQGKSKYVFISLHALLLLFETGFGPFKDKEKIDAIRSELLEALAREGLEIDPELNQKEQEGPGKDGDETKGSKLKARGMKANGKVINLGDKFPPVRYKVKSGELFVHRKTSFEAIGLERAVMACPRGFVPVNDVLKRAGVDLDACYLAGKRERFAYISLAALVTLLDSQDPVVVCLEQKERYSEALLAAVQSGATRTIVHEEREEEGEDGPPPVRRLRLNNFGSGGESVPFRLHEGRVFLSRHSSYLLSGMYDKVDTQCSSAAQGDYDVFEDPAAPLADRGADPDACFLPDGGDRYAFVSVDALLALMNLDGDISRAADYGKLLWKNLLAAVAMESPKLRVHVRMTGFRAALLGALQAKFVYWLEHREEVEAGGDGAPGGPVELVDLVTETEEEVMVVSGAAAPAPKKMRLSLSTSSDSSGSVLSSARPKSDSLAALPEAITAEAMQPGEEEYLQNLLATGIEEERSSGGGSNSRTNSDPETAVGRDVFGQVLSSLESSCRQGLLIGDWQVRACGPGLIRLAVDPGFGASRKMSFLNPDVSALLRYDFALRPGHPPQLRINSLTVPADVVLPIVERSAGKGALNLLYHLHTLRPCFGSFSPELVETVARGGDGWDGAYVDRSFVGSSQTGRAFAGTVRSRGCKVLASSKVGDTCRACDGLKNLVVNRSVLAGGATAAEEEDREGDSEDASAAASGSSARKVGKDGESLLQQKSVWKVEETSAAGTVFLCPQVQSFNTSLPGQPFSLDRQASTVVEHRARVAGADLRASLSLNGRPAARAFDAFERDKAVGPLLEWAASLRLCVGYPDPATVADARYLLAHRRVLQPEIRRFFDHVAVDEDFRGRMADGGADLEGTVRAPACRLVAGEHSDVCDQCRLLQEPIEFLGL